MPIFIQIDPSAHFSGVIFGNAHRKTARGRIFIWVVTVFSIGSCILYIYDRYSFLYLCYLRIYLVNFDQNWVHAGFFFWLLHGWHIFMHDCFKIYKQIEVLHSFDSIFANLSIVVFIYLQFYLPFKTCTALL